jgi:enolase-phosphatase E1
VTGGLLPAGTRVVLLDIEGTTTPVAFVYDVLFPYARARVRDWLAARSPSDPGLREVVDGLRAEVEAEGGRLDDGDRELEAAVARVVALMDQDRKSRALKTLQGRIWEEGYAAGTLRGEVYPDVPGALERWTASGARVGIFSSGSVLAQTLLFRYSTAGDLTPLLRWHFDTAVGPKVDPASYGRIAGAVGVAPAAILFVSDTEKELDAARTAGLESRLCVRPPALPPNRSSHVVVTTFDDLAR